jgi:homoserine acetyltransferase
MGIRLTSIGVGHLAAWVLVLTVYGGWRAWRWADHGMNYTEVAAMVDSVDSRCRPVADNSAAYEAIDSDPSWAGQRWDDCAAAEAFAAEHANVRVSRSPFAAIRYVSPADQAEHEGLIQLSRPEDEARFAPGASVPIYAHDKDPLAYERT